MQSGESLAVLSGHKGKVSSAIFSPDGRHVLTASADRTARIWDAEAGNPIIPALLHKGPVESVAFSPDGMHVVTTSWDKTARIWDAETGKPIGRPLNHGDVVKTAAFSPDGLRVVTASADMKVRIWSAHTGEEIICHGLLRRHCPAMGCCDRQGTRHHRKASELGIKCYLQSGWVACSYSLRGRGRYSAHLGYLPHHTKPR